MSDNTWPGGYRHAMTQAQHAKWNSTNYPGTRQVCIDCDEPTTYCEEDAIYIDDNGPYCDACAEKLEE